MSKKLDAKSIQEKLDGLYKGVDLSSKKQDDKHLLRNERIGISRKGIVFSEEHRTNISKAGEGRIPHNKGKITPEEVKSKQRISHKGAVPVNKQPVLTPSGVFESTTAAGEWGKSKGIKNAYKKLQDYIYNNIDPNNFRYITTEEYSTSTNFLWKNPDHIPKWFPDQSMFRPVETPDGVFETIKDAVEWYKNNNLSNAKRKVADWVKDGTIRYITKQEYYVLTSNTTLKENK